MTNSILTIKKIVEKLYMAFRFLCQVLIYIFSKENGKLDDQRVRCTVAIAFDLMFEQLVIEK